MIRLPFVAVLCLPFVLLASLLPGTARAGVPQTGPFEPQLEVTVPHEPTVLASDGKQHLVYELLLRNFGEAPLRLEELAVSDAGAAGMPIALFDAGQLLPLFKQIGVAAASPQREAVMNGGGSAIVYLLLSFAADADVPERLSHRLLTSAGIVEAAAIGTRHDVLQVLQPPLDGALWLAETGLSNDNGHRRGNLVLGGQSHISRRYAFDWVRVEDGEMSRGDPALRDSYFGYGANVNAVADAVVVGVVDGIAENVPRQPSAVPITLDTVAGNTVVLDLGQGHYAHYMHLQPGSLQVKVGDHVRSGQLLGRVGSSGDSFLPHLHFEITDSPRVLAGEGLPYAFESFQAMDASGTPVRHARELPREGMLVQFGD